MEDGSHIWREAAETLLFFPDRAQNGLRLLVGEQLFFQLYNPFRKSIRRTKLAAVSLVYWTGFRLISHFNPNNLNYTLLRNAM